MTDYPNSVASKISKMLEDTILEALIKAVQNLSIEIDEEELLKMLRDSKKQYRSGYNDGYNDRDSEIVRCKDCNYWNKDIEACDNSDSVCFHNGWCKPDWFCADGERKEDR